MSKYFYKRTRPDLAEQYGGINEFSGACKLRFTGACKLRQEVWSWWSIMENSSRKWTQIEFHPLRIKSNISNIIIIYIDQLYQTYDIIDVRPAGEDE